MTTHPCRVLYVVFDGHLGGSLASCADFLRHTSRAEVEVTFCMLGPAGATSDAIAASGGDVVSFGATSWRDLKATRAFWRYLRKHRFDVIHNNARTMFGHVVIAVANRGAALIYQEHGDLHTEGDATASRAFYRLFRRLYGLFLTVGDDTLEAMVHEGVPRERIVNLESPIDLTLYEASLSRPEARAAMGLPPDGVFVGTACRFVHQKDLGLFLDAARWVGDSDPHVRFAIAGEGADEAVLRARVKILGLESRVWFVGSRSDMPVFWRAIDVFLMTSRQESFGRTILESLASATPIVGVRPEMGGGRILDRADGVRIISGRSPAVLGAALLDICRSPALRDDLGAAGRVWAERQTVYRVENWARRLQDIYTRLAVPV